MDEIWLQLHREQHQAFIEMFALMNRRIQALEMVLHPELRAAEDRRETAVQ